MKRSDLKELIKKSMLEVSPKSGAMTPEEEKMVADYEEEEANKYALDKEEPMEEALLAEDNLEVKSIAKQLYSWLKQNDVNTKLIAQRPSNIFPGRSYGKQIGALLKGGSNEALISYYDDPKTKQTVIQVQLYGGPTSKDLVLQIEKKLLSSYPKLEQYDRQEIPTPQFFNLNFKVKEKTTAKGGLAGNTRLKQEPMEEEKKGHYVTVKAKDGSHKSTLTNLPNHADQTYSGALQSIERLKAVDGRKGKKYVYYVSDKDGNPIAQGKEIEEASVILNRDEVYAKYAPLVKQYMKNGLDKHAAISKAQDVLAKEYGATPLNIQSTISDYFDDQDRNATYANENVLREADEIVAAYAKKKLVKEALDFPRDAVQALADAYKNIEKIYSTFGRDSRFKDEAKQDDYLMIKATLQSINNKLVGLDSDFGYGQGAKLGYEGLNEEMHGGYLELLEMNPDFEEGARLLLNAWFEWKEGPMTEPHMVEEAKQDILAYLSSMMK